jgi:hypothetical protein
MSLSIEALVAAFLAIIFAVFALGAIAREQGGPKPGSPTISAPSFVSAAGSANFLSGNGDKDVLGFY